ncbi:MAG: hypothetical protein JW774_09645 [Candidatus Aureabacteria bacterium]|nr:hypothetical protein [Candidatus Auribacterota bacterium]
MGFPKEDILSAYLNVLRQAILHARLLSLQKQSYEQITDLLDAIHNIPELLTRWEKCDIKWLRQSLEAYDKKWGNKPNMFNLVNTLEKSASEEVKQAF